MQDVVAHIYNLSNQGAKAGELPRYLLGVQCENLSLSLSHTYKGGGEKKKKKRIKSVAW